MKDFDVPLRARARRMFPFGLQGESEIQINVVSAAPGSLSNFIFKLCRAGAEQLSRPRPTGTGSEVKVDRRDRRCRADLPSLNASSLRRHVELPQNG